MKEAMVSESLQQLQFLSLSLCTTARVVVVAVSISLHCWTDPSSCSFSFSAMLQGP